MNSTSQPLSPAKAAPESAPMVSVIIPAYNAARFILEALQSVDAQHYYPLEILLIDDGSTDETVDLVRRNQPNVRIISQANGGVSAARNTGLREATGEFICFLDADDCWFPGKLAAQTAYLAAHPSVGIVYHKWHVWKPDAAGAYHPPSAVDAQGSPEGIDPEFSGWIYHRLLMDCVVHTSTIMMRRTVAREIGFFDTDLVTGEDYDYWLRASHHCEMHKLAATYSSYRSTPGGLTSMPPKKNNEYEVITRAIKRWGLASPDGNTVPKAAIEQRLANLAFGFGYTHYHRGSARIARNAFLSTLRHDPLRWKALAYLAATTVRSLVGRS